MTSPSLSLEQHAKRAKDIDDYRKEHAVSLAKACDALSLSPSLYYKAKQVIGAKRAPTTQASKLKPHKEKGAEQIATILTLAGLGTIPPMKRVNLIRDFLGAKE
jgi:hypothetical protein